MNDMEKNNQNVATTSTQSLIQDLRQIIEQARGHVAATANFTLSMMYWHIGERINREVLDNQRAEYGKQIVASVARQLREEFGSKGFLLCTEGSEEQIELLQLDKAGIKMAKYLTELPPRHVLMQQIQKSLEVAKARINNYSEED